MATAFSRSLLALDSERGTLARLVAGGCAVGGLGLGLWLWLARLPLYAVSQSAAVVQEHGSRPLESAVDGRIERLFLELEGEVQAGQVLIELETRSLQLEAAEAHAHASAAADELGHAEALVQGLIAAQGEAQQGAAQRAEAARLALELRQIELDLAEEELQRLTQLERSGSVSQLTLSKARAAAASARLALASEQVDRERLEGAARQADTDRSARLDEARRAAAQATGNRQSAAARLESLAYAIEQRRVRAPVSGRLVTLEALVVGQMIRAGEPLGSLIVPGELSIRAEFKPADALGRVRLGAPARLSLAGFPEAQFGSLPARVVQVAGEAREGQVRVDLALEALPADQATRAWLARSDLEHGLPGRVRVEVEVSSPLWLLLRTVGAGRRADG